MCMGKIESGAKKRQIQKIILESVLSTGVMAAAVFAPNILWAMKKIGITPHKRQLESIKRTQTTLAQRGLLKITETNISITPAGRAYLLKCLSLGDQKKLNKNKRWDKRWRVLIFDIPESRKRDREQIRSALISIGFKKLQNSVWIYPYDCENIISLLKADTELGEDVLYMIVESLENEDALKKHFTL